MKLVPRCSITLVEVIWLADFVDHGINTAEFEFILIKIILLVDNSSCDWINYLKNFRRSPIINLD